MEQLRVYIEAKPQEYEASIPMTYNLSTTLKEVNNLFTIDKININMDRIEATIDLDIEYPLKNTSIIWNVDINTDVTLTEIGFDWGPTGNVTQNHIIKYSGSQTYNFWHQVNNLKFGNYQVRVYAVTSTGRTYYSDIKDFVIRDIPPAPPVEL